jgi:hypothetical protein
MKIAVRFTKTEELKAVPILMRHSPGMMLPGDIYVISRGAAEALRKAGIRFTEVAREEVPPIQQGVAGGERI